MGHYLAEMLSSEPSEYLEPKSKIKKMGKTQSSKGSKSSGKFHGAKVGSRSSDRKGGGNGPKK